MRGGTRGEGWKGGWRGLVGGGGGGRERTRGEGWKGGVTIADGTASDVLRIYIYYDAIRHAQYATNG